MKRSYFVGIDGEGQGRRDHRYVLLAYSDSSGDRADYIEAEKPDRLSTVQCLEFILSIPAKAKAFSFAFNYDLTKILADVPDRELYLLFRPETRKRQKHSEWGPYPVAYFPDPEDHTHGYSLNLQGTKFTVRRLRAKGASGKTQSRTIWDVFKFFQSSFVTALEKWKVGEERELADMLKMKKKRGWFDRLSLDQIRPYCLSECRNMATLAEKLVTAHEEAGIKLKSFYGAGSTGGEILKELGIGSHNRSVPAEMQEAVMSAFFGGRFEHSVFGPVSKPIDGWDIDSAYPYQVYFLPCLDHARWTYTHSRRRFEQARHALVHYKLGKAPSGLAWGPFPFRFEDGSICFPVESGGGWVWRDEYLAGERVFPHVGFVGAWALESDCKCHPFKRIGDYYKQRLAWGKDGKGIVLKLGCNSVPGKLAQSVGEPPFQCFAWSGMTMSGTRAQLLDLLGMHKSLANARAMATDGLYTSEHLIPPKPRDTGTFDAIDRDTGKAKPLGGWSKKSFPKGMFFVRPGLYFPLDAHQAHELKEVRGRGIGKDAMKKARKLVEHAWEHGEHKIVLPSLDRFWGAKSSLWRVARGDPWMGWSWEYRRTERYGQWKKRPVELDFDPLPKRERIAKDKRTLVVRKVKGTSAPYDAKVVSPDRVKLQAATDEAIEQPYGGDGLETMFAYDEVEQ